MTPDFPALASAVPALAVISGVNHCDIPNGLRRRHLRAAFGAGDFCYASNEAKALGAFSATFRDPARQERRNSRGSATVGLRSRNASCLLGIIFDEQKRCLWLLEFRQRLQHFVAQISNVLTCIY